MKRGQIIPTPTARPAARDVRRPLVALLATLLAVLLYAAPAGAAPGGAAPTSASAAGETAARETATAPQEAGGPVAKLTRRQVVRLQRKLRVRVDGVLGPRTRAALRRFQARHHLTADGRPHLSVLTLLRIHVRTRAIPAPSAAPASVQPAIEAAEATLGVPYRWGGHGPGGFDCSGLMVYVFAQAGIELPRTSFAQYKIGTEVGLTEIQAGDLVFFDTDGPGASHVGIAIDPETVISATTHGVMAHAATSGYWGRHLIGARRPA